MKSAWYINGKANAKWNVFVYDRSDNHPHDNINSRSVAKIRLAARKFMDASSNVATNKNTFVVRFSRCDGVSSKCSTWFSFKQDCRKKKKIFPIIWLEQRICEQVYGRNSIEMSRNGSRRISIILYPSSVYRTNNANTSIFHFVRLAKSNSYNKIVWGEKQRRNFENTSITCRKNRCWVFFTRHKLIRNLTRTENSWRK